MFVSRKRRWAFGVIVGLIFMSMKDILLNISGALAGKVSFFVSLSSHLPSKENFLEYKLWSRRREMGGGGGGLEEP